MKELIPGDKVEFSANKQLVYLKDLGSGGTGEVKLFYEEITDKKFAIKKFSPIPENDGDDSYQRFIDEAKILIDIYHKNIVRVYTYYLFPEQRLGYLQMEFVEGEKIDKYLANNPGQFDKIFVQAIDAFNYLESKGILHRDIRAENMLVTGDELKVIDFGFGKKITESNKDENSVILNYPVTLMPEEISIFDSEYTETTEIYFFGCLFKSLLGSANSNYVDVITKMCEPKKKNRFASFSDIKDAVNTKMSLEFNEKEKKVYTSFAESFTLLINKFVDKREFKKDNAQIINSLNKVYQDNILETYIQNNLRLISCFFTGGSCNYKKKPTLSVLTLKNFCDLLNASDPSKQNIIINGIKNRLSAIDIEKSNDLPF